MPGGVNWADPDDRKRYYREYARRWRSENLGKVRAAGRKHDRANRDARNAKKLAHRHLNLEKVRAHDRDWHARHPEVRAGATKRWRKQNTAKITAASAKRYADKLQRTPPWADLKAIRQFYEDCPRGHHVDHVVPLRGRTVSGLHVLENLQYLPALENLKKGNSFEGAE